MIGIVVSRADSASGHIGEQLLALADWETDDDDSRVDADGGGRYYRADGFELRTFDDLHLDLERPADAFSTVPDLVVFASRHSGATGPLLTGHFTGNFGPAEYGGEDRALAMAAPNALAALLGSFDEYAPGGYEVGMECTHHGPTEVGVPSLFAELGSGDEQWDDPDGAEAVARAILELRGVSPHRERRVVGFGGGHYVPRFERIVRETPWAVGHVGADWALEAMGDPEANEDVIEAAFDASGARRERSEDLEGTTLATIEGDRPALERVIEDIGHRVVTETWLREVGDRSLDLVAEVESALGRIDDGVRFGNEAADSFAVVDLPDELVGAAEGIDPDRTRDAVERHGVAFETTDGGSRVGDRAALPDKGARAEIVSVLADLLEEKYESVRVEGDAVVAEERGFDPTLAREAGVPEGPKFGALASGEPVEVDGETVRPETVSVDRTRRFPF